MSAPEPSKLVQLVVVPALFCIGAQLSLAFAVMPEVLVMLWLPNSLLLATLLRYRQRRYGYFAALVIVAEIVADYPTFSVVESILFGLINILEATIAYLLLRHWKFDPRFTTPNDIAKFVMAGPLIGAFVAAASAAAVYYRFRGIETTYFDFLQVWWFSDSLGLMLMTPLVLSFWPPMPDVIHERPVLRWYDGAALAAIIVVLIAFILEHQTDFIDVGIRPVLLIPIMVYVAARFDMRITILIQTAIAAVILYVAKNGQHPFGDLPMDDTVTLAQQLIFVMSVMSLGLASLLSQLRANARELEMRVRQRTVELSESNTRLELLAVTDPLTGILNRRALFNLMRREMTREQRLQRTLSIIMLDIDYFKKINDRFGHTAGDAVLRHVTTVVAKAIRNIDTLARYGGEEFVLVAPETSLEEALQLAGRMLDAIRTSAVTIDRQTVKITASFGVATLRPGDSEPEHLLRRADHALYAAKAAGRDRIMAEAPAPEQSTA